MMMMSGGMSGLSPEVLAGLEPQQVQGMMQMAALHGIMGGMAGGDGGDVRAGGVAGFGGVGGMGGVCGMGGVGGMDLKMFTCSCGEICGSKLPGSIFANCW